MAKTRMVAVKMDVVRCDQVMNVLLKAESKGFAYGLDVGYEKKNEVKITLYSLCGIYNEKFAVVIL